MCGPISRVIFGSARYRLAGFMILATLQVGAPHQAVADIALAIGVTRDPNDGLAWGVARRTTEDEARRVALSECRAFKGARQAASACRVIGSLADGCVAIAFDPKTDSSGMGWTVAKDRDTATAGALENCRAAAPPGRAEYCKIDFARCEGD